MKMYKSYLFIALFSLLSIGVNSCSAVRGSHGADGYQIIGKMSNLHLKQAYLDEISQSGFTSIDTVDIDDKGNFMFHGNVKEPLFCALRFNPNAPDEKRVFLVIDSNSKIKLEADYDHLEAYHVKGSKDCELIQELIRINLTMQEKIKSLDVKYAAYDPNNLPDSIAAAVRAEFAVMDNEHKASIRRFIEENKSISIYFAALFMMQDPPFELLQKTDETGYALYPNSKYAKGLHAFVESRKATAKGSLAPEITLADVNGNNLSLSSLRGQVVLIDFWASWCGPCRRENPTNVALYAKYHDKGFEIFGVSLDNNKEKWTGAIQEDKLPWKHVSDLGGWQSSAAQLYNVSSIPQTFLLDREGRIIDSGLRGEDLAMKLREIFGY